MYDFSHLFPGGYPAPKAKPVRTPQELAESLLRWKCSEYAPGVQCHFCDDCKTHLPCGLCIDLKEAAELLLEGARALGAEAEIEPEKILLPKGAQD